LNPVIPKEFKQCSCASSLNLQELMTMSNDSVKVYRIMKSELKKKNYGCCARKKTKIDRIYMLACILLLLYKAKIN
jgi:hypothetical protein